MDKDKHAAEDKEHGVAAPSAPLPRARVKRGRRFSWVWLVPLIAAAFIGWLLYRTFIQTGPTIKIRFREGKGIETGKTTLKYRGVKVGDVTALKLSPDQRFVEVKVQLDGSAAGIARLGSEFWVVHPEVSLAGIRGLGTIVSGNFIQVEPGHGPKTNEFFGLEHPPIVSGGSTQGLHLVLLTAQLASLTPGTAVLYRGYRVGETTRNELSDEAQTIRIHVHIHPQFKALVRKNTRFWNAGGINVNLGLFGADITAQSMRTLVAGGLAFATPDELEDPAPEGMVFRLYEKPRDEWLNWAPAIKLPPARTNEVEEPSQL